MVRSTFCVLWAHNVDRTHEPRARSTFCSLPRTTPTSDPPFNAAVDVDAEPATERPGDARPSRELRHAPLHLLGGDVLDVRGDRPAVAERVAHRAGTVAVELVRDGVDLRGAGRDRLGVHGVGVLDVEADRGG